MRGNNSESPPKYCKTNEALHLQEDLWVIIKSSFHNQ